MGSDYGVVILGRRPVDPLRRPPGLGRGSGRLAGVGTSDAPPPPRSVTPDTVDPAKRRYAVIGTGAIGGYYGAQLAAAGHEVHFVARADLEVLQRAGLRVDSPGGDVLVHPVSVFGSAAEVPPV